MSRRFHIPELVVGLVQLDARQSRHLRDVLRIGVGQGVELFDAAGRVAQARVVALDELVSLRVDAIEQRALQGNTLVIAAAVPKGPRADWMVEKLSELGVEQYIPLETARGVVHPEAGKLRRWSRIAEESAKQCRRSGVMQIAAPVSLDVLCADPAYVGASRWCMAAGERSVPVGEMLAQSAHLARILALVGPEGGWTDQELALVRNSHFHLVCLTGTILRIETAALAVTAIVMARAGEQVKEHL